MTENGQLNPEHPEIESKLETVIDNDLGDNTAAVDSNKPKRLNKTQRKYLRYQKKIESYKLKKVQKKEKKKQERLLKETEISTDLTENRENKAQKESSEQVEQTPKNFDNYLNKRELKKRANERLANVYKDSSESLKICIDCSFSSKMSDKEQSRLAQQIGRCYATNKAISSPVHLTLCNLDKSARFYSELVRNNDGFERYMLATTDKSIENLYQDKIALNSVCYLSPDAPNNLEVLDKNCVYVIGGLVDETVSKKVTLSKCENLKISSLSLPIDKYMKRKVSPDQTYTYSRILAVNQVFDILAHFYMNNDWPKALDIGVPKRKGFIIDKNN
jgi:Trm5-related predicted tRNA methylase